MNLYGYGFCEIKMSYWLSLSFRNILYSYIFAIGTLKICNNNSTRFLFLIAVCGGLLFAEEKDSFLYSHAGFADVTYSDSEDCEWVIEGEEEGPIELTFITFEIEDENECSFDYVEVLYTSSLVLSFL